jgi:cysteine desulfurase
VSPAALEGGGQERGFRSGTLNVTGIVGLGKACEIAMQAGDGRATRAPAQASASGSSTRSPPRSMCPDQRAREKRLPHIANISFGFVEGESLMMAVKEIACLRLGACTSASLEPSYVLKRLGVGDDLAHSSLRISLGRWTTEEESRLRRGQDRLGREASCGNSPLYDMHKEGIDISKVEWAH